MFKFIHADDQGRRLISLPMRHSLLLLLVFLAALTGMGLVLVQGVKWLSTTGQPDPGPENTFAFNPLTDLKDALGRAFTPAANEQSPNTVVQVVSEESQTIEVVKKASPAVVSIIASAEVPKIEQCTRGSYPQGVPPEFGDFFDWQFPSYCQNGTEKKRVGAGTGFIVSTDGYIVTNKHVVSDAKGEYTVVLNDEKNYGKKVIAKVLARDPNNDIAILKIDMNNLPYIEFGDSGSLQVGQTAIAIGYALGEFDNTVSKGVVSGLARSIVAGGARDGSTEQLTGLIQTDAAINPGNSGGPLLNIAGQVIGVNVAQAQAQSIGFAIPSNAVRRAYEQVKTSGTITAAELPYIGIRYMPITAELKDNNNLPYDYGMLVVRGERSIDLAVMPGSPAAKAGIVENDIILELNGKQLNERTMLSTALSNFKPGDKINLKIYHQGKEKIVTLTLDRRPNK